MALSQKHRVALFERFLPSLGDELTEAFLAEFPVHDGDELVTRSFFQTEMGAFRAELRAEMADVRAELRAEMAEVRAEMAEVRAEMAEVRTDIHREAAETNRRITSVALGVAGVLIAAGSALTTVIVVAMG